MPSRKCRKKIGILGGTFDPVHFGHLIIARYIVENLKLDRFLFIPAGSPPHKSRRKLTDYKHRSCMVKLAIENNPSFEFCPIEKDSLEKSFSVSTLENLRKLYDKMTRFYFVIGMDSFVEIKSWYHYKELFTLSQVVVINRPGYPLRYRHEDFAENAIFIKIPGIDISSSYIRSQITRRDGIRYLVSDEVGKYIKKHKLYEKGS